MTKLAVVTGGNKGVGFEIIKGLAKQFQGIIYLTARNEKLGEEAVRTLAKINLSVKFHQLDIDSTESIQRFAKHLKDNYKGLDLLVNNAAINYMHEKTELSIGQQAEHVIRVNFTGTLNVCNFLFPLLNEHARVVNISSRMGLLRVVKDETVRKRLGQEDLTIEETCQIMQYYVRAAKDDKHESTCPCTYSMSKVGLNTLTRIQQKQFDRDFPDRNIMINAVTPGYVATDMTKHKGTLTAEQGAITPLHLCFMTSDQPKGVFWADLNPMSFD